MTAVATTETSVRDEAGFEAFARAYATRLLRTAVLLVGDRQDAEDLVQICLLRVANAWDRAASEAPHAYAHTVLTRLATDRWRSLRYRTRRLPLVDGPTERDDMGRVDIEQTLLAAMRALPTRQRAALVLRYWNGLGEAEIAQAMGCSQGTVKTHLARGVARSRQIGRAHV